MRKLLLSLILLAGWAFHLQAQGLYVYQPNVTTAILANEIGDITFTDQGKTLNLAGLSFPVEQIDSVVYDKNISLENKVNVQYKEQQAFVYIGGGCATYVTAKVTASDVILSSSQLIGDEHTYELSGNSQDGSFLLNGLYKCTIRLNGVNLNNKRGAAIGIENGKRIGIELVAGTVNTLSDAFQGLHKACFYVKGHPEFKGKGSLNLVGNSSHAFDSKEYTQFKEDLGKITVTSAVKDGFHCGQYFEMRGGELSISGTHGDCLQAAITTDSTDIMNGQFIMTDGTIHLDVAAEDVKGIKVDSLITISGGTIIAKVSGNGSKGITTGTDMVVDQTLVPTIIQIDATGGVYMPGDIINEAKCMGINIKRDLTINAGTVNVTNTGDRSKGIKVMGIYTQGDSAVVNANFSY